MKIYAISDQHGHLPTDIPKCDLLLVAGDQCPDIFGGLSAKAFPDRQREWFTNEWLDWRDQLGIEHVLVTWGNHDFCGEQDINKQVVLFSGNGYNTHTVIDDVVEVGGLRVYLTPWSNQFFNWAFMKAPYELGKIYDEIPEGIDILVSHQPPYGYGSQCIYWDPTTGKRKVEQVGSHELAIRIREVKPRAVVCGHVHSGYGTYTLDGIPVYNVSVVNEKYELVNPATEIILT